MYYNKFPNVLVSAKTSKSNEQSVIGEHICKSYTLGQYFDEGTILKNLEPFAVFL